LSCPSCCHGAAKETPPQVIEVLKSMPSVVQSDASTTVSLPFGKQFSSPVYYPMHCLPMGDFASLPIMQSHEDLKEQLICPGADQFDVHFISHEWLSIIHPDPDRVQLHLMQDIIEKFIRGEGKSCFEPAAWNAFLKGVSMGTGASMQIQRLEKSGAGREEYDADELAQRFSLGCVWLDYHSIPQDKSNPDFLAGVSSIPHYVERSSVFWICAPTAMNHDLNIRRNYYTWRSRGWCRFEDCANTFSESLKMPLIATSSQRMITAGWFDRLHAYAGRAERSVGHGEFSCCSMGHKVLLPDGTQKTVKCDKEAIAQILAKLLDGYFTRSLATADDSKWRLAKGMQRLVSYNVLAGLEDYTTVPERVSGTKIEDLLDLLGYGMTTDLDEYAKHTVMFWALMVGSVSMIEHIHETHPDAIFARGMGNSACLPYAVHRPLEEFRAIMAMDRRCTSLDEVNYSSASGFTVIDRSAKMGFHEVLKYLLQLGGNANPRRTESRATPLIGASEEGYWQCVQVLLEFSADVAAVDSYGRSALHLACRSTTALGNIEPDGKLRVVKLLLAAKADSQLVDLDGHTPLQVAMETKFEDAVALLSNAGEMP